MDSSSSNPPLSFDTTIAAHGDGFTHHQAALSCHFHNTTMLLPSTTIAQSSVILAQPSHTLSHLLLGSPSSIPPPFYTAANSHTASPHTLTALSCASALLQQSTCVVPTSYMFAMVPASSPDQGFKFTPHNCSHFLRFPPKLRIFFQQWRLLLQLSIFLFICRSPSPLLQV